jgi:hypothetical protein
MTEMQELEAFETQVRADAALRTMLEDMTRSVAAEGESQTLTRVDPLAGLWLVGVVALWKLAKAGIEHLRGLSELDILAKQLELVREVQALGYDAKQATQVVERLLKGMRTRPNDDPVLKALLKIVNL